MHPGFFGWWQARHAGGCAEGASAGEERGGWHGRHHGFRGAHGHGFFAGHHDHDDDGPHFGVRRPLRFMAHKLDLSEDQVATLASILAELKTERAQAAVDMRRRLVAISDALESADFDPAKVTAAQNIAAESHERVRKAVATTLERTHALLTPEQRKKLAYFIRTGVLTI